MRFVTNFPLLPILLKEMIIEKLGVDESFQLLKISKITRKHILHSGAHPRNADVEVCVEEFTRRGESIFPSDYLISIRAPDGEMVYLKNGWLRQKRFSDPIHISSPTSIRHFLKLIKSPSSFYVRIGMLQEVMLDEKSNFQFSIDYPNVSKNGREETTEFELTRSLLDNEVKDFSLLVEYFELFEKFLKKGGPILAINGRFHLGNDVEIEALDKAHLVKICREVFSYLSSITLVSPCENLFTAMRPLNKQLIFEVHSLLQYDWCLGQFAIASWSKNENSRFAFDVFSPTCPYEQLDIFYWLIFDELKRSIKVEEIPLESPKFEPIFQQFCSTKKVFFATEEGPKPYAKIFERAINKEKVELYCVTGIEVKPRRFHARLTMYILDRI